MKRKILLILEIIIFLIILLYTAFFTFIDCIAKYKTIKIENQNDYIVKEIKEHFKIHYDIEKVTFYSGIPDGYYLKIYDMQNVCHHEFEDHHEGSKICAYFKNVRADVPVHLYFLIIEIIVEIIIIYVFKKKYIVDN